MKPEGAPSIGRDVNAVGFWTGQCASHCNLAEIWCKMGDQRQLKLNFTPVNNINNNNTFVI